MRIGLIGTGNMGTALMGGYLKANPKEKANVFAFDVIKSSLEALVEATGAGACDSVLDLAKKSDLIILAVKPNTVEAVLAELKGQAFLKDKIILSIAAGISIDFISRTLLAGGKPGRNLSEGDLKIIRTMPNTPALIGKGMTAVVRGANVDDGEFAEVKKILSAVGGVEVVSEGLIDSVIGVSGSAPAYVYMFIEAMADGAVALGMERQQAYRFAAGTVAGAAEMVKETGLQPGELKDKVCSPGGTTIEAVRVLEEKGFRSAVIEGVKAAGAKSKEISR